MTLPAQLTFHDCGYSLDGGTYRLCATDERGTEHQVTLAQRLFVSPDYEAELIPGRLYFDGELVAIRSELEAELLRLFKAAAVRPTPGATESSSSSAFTPHAVVGEDIKRFLNRTPEERLRGARDEVIAFTESDEYVSLAAAIGPQRDSAR